MDTRISTTYDPQSIARAQADFMQKVYAWMIGGLLVTGATAWYVFDSGLYIQLFRTPFLFWGLLIGEVGLVFFLSARVMTLPRATASLLFLGYAFLNGLTFSALLAAYTAESIQQVFLISAVMFGALSAYGYVTKRDLTAMGKFLMMGLVGLVVAMFVNILFQQSILQFVISVVGIIVFAGLTAYDTQKLKEMSLVQLEHGEMAAGGAILGALVLYLDFINLFIMLLRIFGDRK